MWSDEAWAAIENVFAKILDLEFVKELGEGTLSEDRFLTYMEQDKLYLNDYGRALALIAARAQDAEDVATYARFGQNAILAEQSLHDFYLNHIGDASARKPAAKNPSCELYTSFLLKTAALAPIEVAAAAVLPCFWIYDVVGIHHTKQLAEAKQAGRSHAYARWIELYSSPEFTADTKIAREFCDKLAEKASPERRQEMIDAFVKSSVLEFMFWDASYKNEAWPV